jgi:ABC-2 type transport system permease protein
MLIMAVVFSALLAQSVADYPVFILSGLIIWKFIEWTSTQAIADLIYGGGALMGKVYVPRSIFAVASIGTGLINLLLSMIPLVLLMIILGTPVTLVLLILPVSIATVAGFSLGLGLFMSALAVFFADMQNIHRIMMQLLMYLSGIFYTLDFLPKEIGTLVAVVPTYHLVALFREPLYAGSLPSGSSMLYAGVMTLVMLISGFWVFMRLSDGFAYRV